MKILSTVLMGLGSLAISSTVAAQAYQIEADASLSRSSIDFDRGGDADVNNISLGARYYLEQVETVGPWGESAFLQKSSWAGIELVRVSGDANSDTDFGVDAHYVTPDDLIVGGELSSSDGTDIAIFGGKYLDDRTTVIGRIALGDIDSIGAEYKTLMQLGSGNDLAVEAGISLLDAADTGFELDGSATYFVSDQLGVSAGLTFQDVGDFDQTTIGGAAEYFVSETLAARAALLIGSADTSDSTTILLGVTGRF